MSDRIEKAQDIVADELAAMLQADENAWITDNACVIVDALGKAGLLAPSPLREEWGVRWDDHDIWGDMYNTRHEAETGAGDEGTPVHRFVTDWEET